MKNNRLNFYFFGDIGSYDNFNPSNICNKGCAPELLYLAAENNPFSIKAEEIAVRLGIDLERVKKAAAALKSINAIEVKNDTYKVNFPVFLERDVLKLEEYLNHIGEKVSGIIIDLKDELYEKISKLQCSKYYSRERILYHVICDNIFDGTAFDFFGEKGVFCTSKLQPGNRDYLIIAYEDSKVVEAHSNKLLCSSNNYSGGGVNFNSFGDSNGARRDMMRFFRLLGSAVSSVTQLDSLNTAYIKLLGEANGKIIGRAGELIKSLVNGKVKLSSLGSQDKSVINFLKELQYVDEKYDILFIKVPVFYENESKIVHDISALILSNIYPIVKETFDAFESNLTDITSVKHNVDIKEVANELWHQIFGAASEAMIESGFVEAPQYVEGEGRYLRSITIMN